jgi:hypothetical protein
MECGEVACKSGGCGRRTPKYNFDPTTHPNVCRMCDAGRHEDIVFARGQKLCDSVWS